MGKKADTKSKKTFQEYKCVQWRVEKEDKKSDKKWIEVSGVLLKGVQCSDCIRRRGFHSGACCHYSQVDFELERLFLVAYIGHLGVFEIMF